MADTSTADDTPPGGPESRHAGGTYAPRDQSEAARRSEVRVEQHPEDSEPAYIPDKQDYGQRDPSDPDRD